MADYFVWHGSAQDDSDANWNSSTLAFLDLDTALGTAAAGDDVWIADDHSKTYGADTTLNNAGTYANPVRVTCVNRTTGAVSSGAVEKTTGSTHSLNIHQDHIIYRGIDFASGDSIAGDGDSLSILENCTVELSGNNDNVTITADGQNIIWRDVTFKTGHAGNKIWVGGGTKFLWDGGGIDTGGTAITQLLYQGTARMAYCHLRNLDLSNMSSSIVTLSGTYGGIIVDLLGCKFPNGVNLVDDDPLGEFSIINAISCDNGDGFYYFEHRYWEGKVVQATNCYLNFKYDGTNYCSAKMISGTNAVDQKRPLRYKLAEFWSDSANPTVTVETIADGVTLQDDEFWVEIESPDATDEALRNIDRSSRQTVGWSGGSGPGTPSNLTTSTESWTEDLTSEVKQKVAVTISGGAAGPHTVWACLAKPSTTVYVCPEVTVS